MLDGVFFYFGRNTELNRCFGKVWVAVRDYRFLVKLFQVVVRFSVNYYHCSESCYLNYIRPPNV